MTLNEFYRSQLARWKLAADNYKALLGVRTRSLIPEGNETVMEYTLQFNPARVRSTAARVDHASVSLRPCFLCASVRPEAQIALDPSELDPVLSPGRDPEASLSEEYDILLNPFPIFPCHFTIPLKKHAPQLMSTDNCRRFGDMLLLARAMEGMALFYNGARCGASAPDHFHFQAIPLGASTILSTVKTIPFLIFGYQTTDRVEMIEWFRRTMAEADALPLPADHSIDEPEPRVNVWCAYSGDIWKAIVIPRRAHRPDFYGVGEGKFMVSPASVDLAGTVVLPSQADFDRFNHRILADMIRQTTYPSLT